MWVRPNAKAIRKWYSYIVIIENQDNTSVCEVVGVNGHHVAITLPQSETLRSTVIHTDKAGRTWLYWVVQNEVRRKQFECKIDWDKHDWSAALTEGTDEYEVVWSGEHDIVGSPEFYCNVLRWRTAASTHTRDLLTGQEGVEFPIDDEKAAGGIAYVNKDGKLAIRLENGATILGECQGDGLWSGGVWVMHGQRLVFYSHDGSVKQRARLKSKYVYDAEYSDGIVIVAHNNGIWEAHSPDGALHATASISYPLNVHNRVFYNRGNSLVVKELSELLLKR